MYSLVRRFGETFYLHLQNKFDTLKAVKNLGCDEKQSCHCALHKGIWRKWRYSTRPQPLYSLYPLNRKLGGGVLEVFDIRYQASEEASAV